MRWKVILHERPFNTLILSTVEAYRRECCGAVFGEWSRVADICEVTEAQPYQIAEERGYRHIDISGINTNFRGISEDLLLNIVGDYHSHLGDDSEASLSKKDKEDEDLLENGYISFVISMKKTPRLRRWHSCADGRIVGSVVFENDRKYSLEIAAFFLKAKEATRAEIIPTKGLEKKLRAMNESNF